MSEISYTAEAKVTTVRTEPYTRERPRGHPVGAGLLAAHFATLSPVLDVVAAPGRVTKGV